MRAIEKIMSKFRVLEENDRFDGAYTAYHTMMELTCHEYAAALEKNASSDEITRRNLELSKQMDAMVAKYDARVGRPYSLPSRLYHFVTVSLTVSFIHSL